MTKSYEELEAMKVPVLEGIFKDLTGNEAKRGLKKAELVQLVYDLQQPDQPQENANGDGETATFDDAYDLADLEGDEPETEEETPTEPPRPAKKVIKHTNTDADPREVAEALAHTGLKVAVEGNVVTLEKGTQKIHTTVKQPLYRIVKTAEAFAGV